MPLSFINVYILSAKVVQIQELTKISKKTYVRRKIIRMGRIIILPSYISF